MSGYSMSVAEAVMGELFDLVRDKAGSTASVTRVQREHSSAGILLPTTNDSAAERWCRNIEEAIRTLQLAVHATANCIASSRPRTRFCRMPYRSLKRSLAARSSNT